MLVAGLGDDHHVWDSIFDLLAERHHVIAFDNQGAGRTRRASDPLSIKAMALDALALIDALGLGQVAVVGSSMGGAIAQELVLVAPEAACSLALVGTWGERDDHFGRAIEHIGYLHETIEDPVELFDAVDLWTYSGSAFAERQVAGLAAAAFESDSPKQDPGDFRRAVSALLEHAPSGRLRQITVPRIVTGSEDRLCPPRLGRRLAALIPDAELMVVKDRAHLPFQEAPREFVSLLERFWRQGPPPPRPEQGQDFSARHKIRLTTETSLVVNRSSLSPADQSSPR